MQNFPHHYAVTASSAADDNVALNSAGLETIESAAPVEFDGPGGHWSPETLLVAAVADCFVLSFKAVARASKFAWVSLRCDVEGVLDRVDGVTQFTQFNLHVVLDMAPGTDEQRAMRLLEKSEHVCLITNSLHAETHLDAELRSSAA